MVYRTEKYQKLKSEVEKQSKKCKITIIFWHFSLYNVLSSLIDCILFIGQVEKRKEAHGDSLDKQQKKKIEREEERLKNNNRDLSLVKMKSMFAIGFAFTALLSMFNSIFDGRIVARLPFVPISWIQGLSHRNLPGDDYTECSFIFLYILCTMSIRQVSRTYFKSNSIMIHQYSMNNACNKFSEYPKITWIRTITDSKQTGWEHIWSSSSTVQIIIQYQ